jgi:hypothetical protein
MKRRRLSNRELNEAARHYDGPYKPYDLIKELCVAIAVVASLVLLLTIFLSSPDDRPSTIAQWSRQMPVDFVTTAVSELDGTSGTAGYGPPYNHNGDGQFEWFVHLQKWFGVSHPIDTAMDYVIAPLLTIPGRPGLTAAIDAYRSANSKQQSAWTTAYSNALGKARVTSSDGLALSAGTYGPLPMMMSSLLQLAQAGGLDGALLTSQQFFQTDYTKPLLFLADGSLLADRAQSQHLLGEQWGMMNETGSWPGQVWLWLYTLWYQVKPFSTSANADILVMTMMGALSLLFILIPFLPIVRDIPRWIPLHRLIWREHYAAERRGAPSQP